MYFKEFDSKTKKHFFELKEDFSGAFVFVANESKNVVFELIEIANSIDFNIVICVCPTIKYLEVKKVSGFEIIPNNFEKILSLSPHLIESQLDFLNLYFKKELKFGCAILEESFYFKNDLNNRLSEMKFKSMKIYISKFEIANFDFAPTLYTNQGKLRNANLCLVFKNLEENLNNEYINFLQVQLENTFTSVNKPQSDPNEIEFYPIC